MTDVHNTFRKSPEVELICAETDVVSAGSREPQSAMISPFKLRH